MSGILEELTNAIDGLTGMLLADVTVGDGGFHLEFGDMSENTGCMVGEVSVYGTCAMKLTTTGELLYRSEAIPLPEAEEGIKSHTVEREVVEAAFDHDGKLLAVRGTMIHDTGSYMPWGIVSPLIAATTVPGPYALPNYHLETIVALTNKVHVTPVRGAGRTAKLSAVNPS